MKAKIKLESSIAGNGFCHQVGSVIEWGLDEAARFVERGIAVYAEELTEEQQKYLAKRRGK